MISIIRKSPISPPADQASMKMSTFNQLSSFIHTHYGIKMPPSKKTMLEVRIRKRLKALRIESFEKYINKIFGPDGDKNELIHMIDVITTNKTSFFREEKHFTLLPSIIHETFDNPNRVLNVWSAGCSTGEEPYSLAITFSEYKKKFPWFDFYLLATDLCTEVLENAKKAVYTESQVENIPLYLKKRYLLKK